MANHKRRRAKNRRAGCLLCKPHKMNHARKSWIKPSVIRQIQRAEYVE